MPLEGLTKEQKIELLKRLRRKLQSLCSSLEAPELAMGTNMSCAEVIVGLTEKTLPWQDAYIHLIDECFASTARTRFHA